MSARWDGLSTAAQQATRLIVLDTLGAMLGARAPEHAIGRLLGEYARFEGGAPHSSCVGQPLQTGPSLAALINGTLACALDTDSIHRPSITHAAAGLEQSQVSSITVAFPIGGAEIIDGNPVRSHCGQYVLAVEFLKRNVTFDDLASDLRTSAPQVAALSQRVTVVHSAELDQEFPERYTSRVRVHLCVGRRSGASSVAGLVAMPSCQRT